MDNKEIFEMIKHGVSNEWHLESINRELDSLRQRALSCIKEYKELKKNYEKDIDKQKEINEYIKYLENLADSVQ